MSAAAINVICREAGFADIFFVAEILRRNTEEKCFGWLLTAIAK